ncbi:MAG: hypothetical protein JXK05_04085 [Campylobacterales bacterium]|nr:hypothetical protein [Campylobacterales bacterium]
MKELKLYAPNEFWAQLSIDDLQNCNGCGSELDGSNRIVPDTMWGLNIRICCCIHDDMYTRGVTLGDKLFADAVFLMNLASVIIYESSTLMKALRLYRAATYYTAVATAGDGSFFHGKTPDLRMTITFRGSFQKLTKKENT